MQEISKYYALSCGKKYLELIQKLCKKQSDGLGKCKQEEYLTTNHKSTQKIQKEHSAFTLRNPFT